MTALQGMASLIPKLQNSNNTSAAKIKTIINMQTVALLLGAHALLHLHYAASTRKMMV